MPTEDLILIQPVLVSGKIMFISIEILGKIILITIEILCVQ